MSDTTSAGPTGTKHTPVKKVDPAKPFFIVLTQSEARNVMTIHEGPDALAEAKAEASRRAASTKSVAMVIGPQRSVFQPPKEPEITEVQTEFDI